MHVHVLGSGGNTPIPTPTCTCTVCEQARDDGIPYSRGGNSLYLPDLAAIVDAPEFVFDALNREDVTDLDYILLTHWHPDHTNGLRVVQSRDMTAHDGLLDAIADGGPTLLTTETVYERVCDSFGQVEHFEMQGFLDVQFLDSPVEIGGATVTTIPYALEDEDLDAAAFVIERGGTTVVIALDDARYLDESKLPADIDLAVFECGLFETDPDGAELFTEGDWAFLADELTHEEVLARIERVNPDRTLLTEIEHLTARSYDHFEQRERQQEYDGIEFAHDGKQIEVG